jgi:SAM-dependent methyltransferase
MDRSLLVAAFGFPATLLHYDTLVADRWFWLRKRLPKTNNGERLIDIGCGTGAFTIGAARRGYSALGLSWDRRNQDVACERAQMCGATQAKFEVVDLRHLHQRSDLVEAFEVAICLETIEHLRDDRKLLADVFRILVPGGHLLLTTPNYHYRAITPSDNGPFDRQEKGGHVRRGYTALMLRELCDATGFRVQDISYCSGFLSQKITWLLRRLTALHWMLGWVAILPFRWLPPLLDPIIRKVFGWPDFSICLEAQKPRV